jgi:hypothetical protein
MTEMPIDVIRDHLATSFDEPLDADQALEHAMDLDQELQQKFLSIPYGEIRRIEIQTHEDKAWAGDGPERCSVREDENPNWLYNHAMNALALWLHLKETQEAKEKLARISKRPAHGWWLAKAPSGVIVPMWVSGAERRIFTPSHGSGEMAEWTEAYDKGELSGWALERLNVYADQAAAKIGAVE